MDKNKGFTLIELLVVISIVGLLASILMISTQGARIKARDIAQIQQTEALFKALSLYYDTNGVYPTNGVAFVNGSYYQADTLGAYFNPSTGLLSNLTPWLVGFPYTNRPIYYSMFYIYNPPASTTDVGSNGLCLAPGSMSVAAWVQDYKDVPQGSLTYGTKIGNWGIFSLAEGNFHTGAC